ncbi:MAG: hypothetical protein PWP23_2931 [Candidatus Sumerlaeota bacterium]|nr:hypothetical protein [Candidatus Sumerlaeota bacterium]
MIVSFAPDLMMRSKIDVAARHYGCPVRHVATAAECREAVGTGGTALVLLDLDLPGEDMLALVRDARAAGAGRIVGFCSHVMTDLIREAREAGAHTVMANSTFVAAIPGLLAEIAAPPAGT